MAVIDMEYPKGPFKREISMFRDGGGILRTSHALKKGVSPRNLYAMRKAGIIEPLGRGLYRLADAEPLSNPDIVTVAMKIPHGVVCLISALAFHDITTEIPHYVYVALEKDVKAPKLDIPPVRFFWFSGPSFDHGIETHQVDGVPVRVYSVEKTVADCFKFRNRIGLDVALEALKQARDIKKSKVQALMHYAKICRVDRVMKPYLEALL